MLDRNDQTAMKATQKRLNQASHRMAERLYEKTRAKGTTESEAVTSNEGDDVIDAEYTKVH